MVSITKAYKQWARKPDDAVDLAERARLDDFADQRPEMSFAVPDCISLDEFEIEISFTCGMAKVLTDGNSQAMEERWRNISLERFERVVSADESLVMQTKIVENACITIISGKPISQDAMLVVKEQALCFFSPVTQTCRFKVGDDVNTQTVSLKDVFSTDRFGGPTQAISNLLRNIEKSDQPIFKVFSSMPIGKQMLKHAQRIVDYWTHREALLDRLAQVASGSGLVGDDGGRSGLVAMDDAIKEQL